MTAGASELSDWDTWALTYDELFPALDDDDPMLSFLWTVLSNPNTASVLEFGIGTGRIAIPLARAGVRTVGIDISNVMIERLRAKDGGSMIEAIVGDIACAQLPERFDLVLCAFNTLYAVCDQQRQIETLRNAARHLRPEGHLVIELNAPLMMLRGFSFNQALGVSGVSEASAVSLIAGRLYPIEQRVRMHHMTLSASGFRTLPSDHRYIWPSELDLKAQLAGFKLVSRFGGWSGEPFTELSPSYVSRYVLADDPDEE